MKSRKKFSLIITIAFIAIVSIGLFFYEGTLPVDQTNRDSKIFVIEVGEGPKSIVNKLEDENLIRSKVTFFAILYQLQIHNKIQAGDYRLSPSMNAYEIAKELTHGTLDRWITIIEGWRKEEIADKIAAEFNIPATEFITNAEEGYLFPDTYLIPKDATAGGVISILMNNFERKYDEDLKEKVRQLGLTDEEALILASIVEREAQFDRDRVEVASIFIKRYKAGIALDADATVQYALGYQTDQKTWWKKGLSVDDLNIQSPYNTRRVAGLPPGPISNPSLSSLEAVANADPNTPYLFFLHTPNGKTYFGRTLQEHNENIDKYLR
ncbi:MAG: endolytic transglycosylase MltG [Patescibacteria group bacterium]